MNQNIRFSYLDTIESKDNLIRFLENMIEVGYSEVTGRAAIQQITSGFAIIENFWNNERTLEELLKLMNENDSVEVNEDEYTSIREFYEMHNTGFILEEVSYDDRYFRIAKLENAPRRLLP